VKPLTRVHAIVQDTTATPHCCAATPAETIQPHSMARLATPTNTFRSHTYTTLMHDKVTHTNIKRSTQTLQATSAHSTTLHSRCTAETNTTLPHLMPTVQARLPRHTHHFQHPALCHLISSAPSASGRLLLPAAPVSQLHDQAVFRPQGDCLLG